MEVSENEERATLSLGVSGEIQKPLSVMILTRDGTATGEHDIHYSEHDCIVFRSIVSMISINLIGGFFG